MDECLDEEAELHESDNDVDEVNQDEDEDEDLDANGDIGDKDERDVDMTGWSQKEIADQWKNKCYKLENKLSQSQSKKDSNVENDAKINNNCIINSNKNKVINNKNKNINKKKRDDDEIEEEIESEDNLIMEY